MIGLFLNRYSDEKMKNSNGDIIIKDVISATVEMRRNQIWYLNIEFPKDCLRGKKITDECVFKVDLDYIKGQLFRCIYCKENKIKKTYVCYASHVFFDSQKECIAFDDRVVAKNWDNIIKKVNNIIEKSETVYPYKVIGNGSGIPVVDDLEVGKEYVIVNAMDTGYALDVNGAGTSDYTNVQLWDVNGSVSQIWKLEKVSEGVYEFKNPNSGRNMDISGGNIANTANIQIYQDNNSYAQRFVIVPSDSGYIIKCNENSNYCISISGGKTSRGCNVQLGNTNNNIYNQWLFVEANSDDAYWINKNAYWVKKNLIECMFGTQDNSLINRWSEYIDEQMIVAMFDNYDCYFGDDAYYPSNMKSNTIVLATTKELLEYVKEVSMENVATGIIPQAYNGRMLPNNEIIKSDYWDKYMIHRVIFKEYPNLILQGDKEDETSRDDIIFATEALLQNALREHAKVDVDTMTKYPKKSVKIKVADLSHTDNSSINHCKLNDIPILTVDGSGERETFYFDSIKYDVVKRITTEMSLILKE